MKVWIDQDRCTGDAQCVEICPEVFFMHDGGPAPRSYVKEAGGSGLAPDGTPAHTMAAGAVVVPPPLVAKAVEAADYCPGECIFVEDA